MIGPIRLQHVAAVGSLVGALDAILGSATRRQPAEQHNCYCGPLGHT